MDFDDIEALRRHSPAWRLLRSDNAALVLTFLGAVFVEENARSVPRSELASRLDDTLFALNEQLGEGTFPRPARAYLDLWAAPDAGWLRTHYPPGSDEPHVDATPAAQKALAWVASLRSRSFVGTASRLNTLFDLLRQMAFGTETDPDVRIVELERRRRDIDEEITRLRGGDVAVMDASSLRDRYQQFSSTAMELLADFSEVQENFRLLDREMRESITGWGGSKGDLLDTALGSRNRISESDQGKSFHAFYDFLLSRERQEEFTDLLARVTALAEIGVVDDRIRRIHYDWLDAAESTQATVRQLSEQLRRFLDDQVWLENRRVMDILRSIETHALSARGQPDLEFAMELASTSPRVALPMERPLYQPRERIVLHSSDVDDARTSFDSASLFEQVHVDRARLAGTVRSLLQGQAQIALGQVVRRHPLEHGLAELVGYLSLEDPFFAVVFDESASEEVHWKDADGTERAATLPGVAFARTHAVTGGDR